MKALKINLNRFTVSLILGPALFLACRFGLSSDPTSATVLGTLLWMMVWWLLEAVPLAITAVLPLIIFPATKVSTFQELSRSYGNEVLFLFLGGFILSLALEKSSLIHRFSKTLLNPFLGNAKLFLLGIMLCAFLLSMFVSNTAAALILFPLVQFVVQKQKGHFEKAALLGVAYSASIGGTATLIGSPTNPLTAQFLKSAYQIDFGFLDWFKVSILFSLVGIFLLWSVLGHNLKGKIQSMDHYVVLSEKMNRTDIAVLTVFIGMTLCWVLSGPLDWSDTTISLAGGLILFLIPGLLTKDDVRALPWEIFLLFGGGIALAQGIQNSNLTADFLAMIEPSGILNLNPTLLIFIVVSIVILFTEFASNTATVSLFVPILGPLASEITGQAIPFYLAICYAASLSFMMPMATPPNAIAFSSGALSMRQMISVGWKLNLIFAVWITIYCSYIIPWLI